MDISEISFQPGTIKHRAGREDVAALLDQLPGWRIETNGTSMLAATFDFPDFESALAFADRVGKLAGRFDHHPELTVSWGKTVVRWWTHTAGGVAINDFVLARETSRLAEAGPQD